MYNYFGFQKYLLEKVKNLLQNDEGIFIQDSEAEQLSLLKPISGNFSTIENEDKLFKIIFKLPERKLEKLQKQKEFEKQFQEIQSIGGALYFLIDQYINESTNKSYNEITNIRFNNLKGKLILFNLLYSEIINQKVHTLIETFQEEIKLYFIANSFLYENNVGFIEIETQQNELLTTLKQNVGVGLKVLIQQTIQKTIQKQNIFINQQPNIENIWKIDYENLPNFRNKIFYTFNQNREQIRMRKQLQIMKKQIIRKHMENQNRIQIYQLKEKMKQEIQDQFLEIEEQYLLEQDELDQNLEITRNENLNLVTKQQFSYLNELIQISEQDIKQEINKNNAKLIHQCDHQQKQTLIQSILSQSCIQKKTSPLAQENSITCESILLSLIQKTQRHNIQTFNPQNQFFEEQQIQPMNQYIKMNKQQQDDVQFKKRNNMFPKIQKENQFVQVQLNLINHVKNGKNGKNVQRNKKKHNRAIEDIDLQQFRYKPNPILIQSYSNKSLGSKNSSKNWYQEKNCEIQQDQFQIQPETRVTLLNQYAKSLQESQMRNSTIQIQSSCCHSVMNENNFIEFDQFQKYSKLPIHPFMENEQNCLDEKNQQKRKNQIDMQKKVKLVYVSQKCTFALQSFYQLNNIFFVNILIKERIFESNEQFLMSNKFKILVIDSNMTNPAKISSFQQQNQREIEEQLQASISQLTFWITLINNFHQSRKIILLLECNDLFFEKKIKQMQENKISILQDYQMNLESKLEASQFFFSKAFSSYMKSLLKQCKIKLFFTFRDEFDNEFIDFDKFDITKLNIQKLMDCIENIIKTEKLQIIQNKGELYSILLKNTINLPK